MRIIRRLVSIVLGAAAIILLTAACMVLSYQAAPSIYPPPQTAVPAADALSLTSRLAAQPVVDRTDLAIDGLSREYALHAGRFLSSIVWMSPAGSVPSPAPLDVVAWYHVLIVAKTNRALMSAAHADGDEAAAIDDANGSAKIALIGIDRSRKALGAGRWEAMRAAGAALDPDRVHALAVRAREPAA